MDDSASPRHGLLSSYLEHLGNQLVGRHSQVENWSPATAVAVAIARAFSRDPYGTASGYLLAWAVFTGLFLVPVTLYAMVAREWQSVMTPRLGMIAVLWAGALWFLVTRTREAARLQLSLHAAISDPEGMQRIISWDRRWFSHRPVAVLTFTFLALVMATYTAIQRVAGPEQLPVETLVISVTLFYFMGEIFAAVVLLIAEYPMLLRENFQLFPLNPAHTLAIRRSLRGYNQIAMLSSFYMTVAITFVAVLFPLDSRLLLPIIFALLALAYSTIALVVVAPRILMTKIVRKSKDAQLADLQFELSHLWEKRAELGDNQLEELHRLAGAHDALCHAPDDLLNAPRILGATLGSILLPTLVAVFAATIQRIVL